MLPLKSKVDHVSLETMYNIFCTSYSRILEYRMGKSVWLWKGENRANSIYALPLITGATEKSIVSQLYIESGWLPTEQIQCKVNHDLQDKNTQ